MASKKRKKSKKNTRKVIQAKPSPQQLKAIERLMNKGEPEQAIARFESLLKQYPKFSVLYRQGIDIYEDVQLTAKAAWTALRWTQNTPNSLKAWETLFELSVENGQLALASHAIDKYNDLAEKQNAEYVIDTALQQDLQKAVMSDALGNPKPNSMDDALVFDIGKLLLEARQWRECLGYFESVNTYPPAKNNYAVALFQMGKIEDAINAYQTTFEQDSDNLFAMASCIRLLVWNDQLEQANQMADKLKTMRPTRPFYADSQLAALAFLGRYEEAFSCYQSLNDNVIDDMNEGFYHLAGAIAFRVGEMELAKELWQKVPEDFHRGEAENPLKLLNVSTEKKRKPALFAFSELLPTHWEDKLSIIANNPDGHNDVMINLAKALSPHPSFDYLRLAYESCDDKGKFIIEFLLIGLSKMEDEQAKELLLSLLKSQRTDLESKMELLRRLQEAGIISNNDSTEYWNGEDYSKIQSWGFAIHREPKEHSMSSKDSDLFDKAISLMREQKLQKSRVILQQLIKQYPHEDFLRGNFAATWEYEDRDRCIKEYESTLKDFPDYLFARCMLAKHRIEDGKLDEAQALIGDLWQTTKEFHISEYILISGVNAYLLAEQGNKDGALSYFKGVEQAVEYDDEIASLDNWKDIVERSLNPPEIDFRNIDTKKLLNKLKKMTNK